MMNEDDKDDKAKQKKQETPQEEQNEELNLDLRKVKCFGFKPKGKLNWANYFKDKQIIDEMFFRSLANDVDQSIDFIASYVIRNLDDDMDYDIKFNNKTLCWEMSILDSDKAEIDEEYYTAIAQSPFMKKLAQSTSVILRHVYSQFQDNYPKIKRDADFALVDTDGLHMIMDMLDKDMTFENINSCKFNYIF